MIGLEGYVPILLTKRGERTALHDLSATARGAMCPLLVVEPIPWNYDDECDAKTVDQHLGPKPQQLVDSWGVGEAFIDLAFIGDAAMENGDHPLVWMTDETNTLGLPLLPVVGVSQSSAYRAAASAVVARDRRGACIRLTISEWPTAASSDVTALLADLGIGQDECDLVLDLGEEVAAAPALANKAARLELAAVGSDPWRSLVIAGGGFPKAAPAGQGVHVIERAEWTLYQDLMALPPTTRTPTFGDYAIAHPDPLLDVNPAYMNLSATIRYTDDGNWLISKGQLFKATGGRGLGGPAVPPTAAALVTHPDFTSGHCGGETWIEAAAIGGPTGNAETWRRHGTAHHLHRVTDQLATLHAPSTTP